ncbi:MAG: orotidine-5'-phosphate decarboxylase [Chloroflexi bacterium]|nr:orotidine-5'-phosphate decarboxylase [Chloroflexota bacterium]
MLRPSHAESDLSELKDATSSFAARLAAAQQRAGSLLCVGLDPDPARLPEHLRGERGGVARFLLDVVAATRDLVCAFKPNLAFFEALGDEGLAALGRVREDIAPPTLVIGDGKRADLAHSGAAYARAMFEVWQFDAVTTNPYMGLDAIAPFCAYADRGVFVLCHTSNPGAADFQDLLLATDPPRPLYEVVAERVQAMPSQATVGLVVGATYPEQLRRVRGLVPDRPLLVPGIGPQRGDLAATVRAGDTGAWGHLIINSSRQVLYASSGADYAAAARHAAEKMRDEINALRAGGD